VSAPPAAGTERAGPPRIPLNFFGIPFGLSGLAGAWVTVAHYGQAPAWVGDALLVIAAAAWVLIATLYARYAVSGRGRLAGDLVDHVAGPFASLAVITPILLAAQGLYPYAAEPGRVLVDVFLALTVLVGAWFTGQWIYGPLELDRFHPGYFLPTVAGGFVASAAAAEVGQLRLAEFMFGFGLFCWLILGSTILFRLFFRPPLPPALTPTLAIEVAPAATAFLALLAINGNRINAEAAAIAGYGVLMALAQIRLVPAYLRLKFTPSFWAFTFGWAAVASSAIRWVNEAPTPGARAYAYVAVAAITALIGGIAIRTVVAVFRQELLPGPGTGVGPVPSPSAPGEAGTPAHAS
jgi:tellurite resistance protein